MKMSIKVDHKRGRGRPATGRGVMVSARLPSSVVFSVDDWAAKNETTRSDSIRRLVEIGLSVGSARANPQHARDEAVVADGLLKPSVDLPDHTRLEEIELPSKIVAILTRAHVHVLGELRQITDEKLMRVASLGRQRVAFLRKALGGGSHQLVEFGQSNSVGFSASEHQARRRARREAGCKGNREAFFPQGPARKT